MSWGEIFLGIIAVSTLIMAVIQVAFVLYGWTVARKLERLLGQLEGELKPLIESANSVGRDIARATNLAAAQVERVDQLLASLAVRVEETAATVQNAIITPIREGAAVVAGIRTALTVLKEVTRKRSDGAARSEDEEPLFIG